MSWSLGITTLLVLSWNSNKAELLYRILPKVRATWRLEIKMMIKSNCIDRSVWTDVIHFSFGEEPLCCLRLCHTSISLPLTHELTLLLRITPVHTLLWWNQTRILCNLGTAIKCARAFQGKQTIMKWASSLGTWRVAQWRGWCKCVISVAVYRFCG